MRISWFGPALYHPEHSALTTFAIELVDWAAEDGFGYVREVLGWSSAPEDAV